MKNDENLPYLYLEKLLFDKDADKENHRFFHE